MVVEYFFESIVLLSHVLCVPYEVLYIESKNSRAYDVEPLTAQQMKNFKKYFKQDYMMYDYFNKTLHRKVEEFGRKVILVSFFINVIRIIIITMTPFFTRTFL